jgi:hypothetical protein
MRRKGYKTKRAIMAFWFCSLSLAALSTNVIAQGRRGAEVVVNQKYGNPVKGELVAVKKDSILLLKSEAQQDVSVNISEISSITVIKKPKILESAGLGLLIGGGVGALAGLASGTGNFFGFHNVSAGNKAAGLGLCGGGIGLVGGLIYGMAKRHEEKLQIEGKSDPEVQVILKQLASNARVRDFR